MARSEKGSTNHTANCMASTDKVTSSDRWTVFPFQHTNKIIKYLSDRAMHIDIASYYKVSVGTHLLHKQQNSEKVALFLLLYTWHEERHGVSSAASVSASIGSLGAHSKLTTHGVSAHPHNLGDLTAVSGTVFGGALRRTDNLGFFQAMPLV